MRIGTTYVTWFDYDNPGSGPDGNGWKHNPNPNNDPDLQFCDTSTGYVRPFHLPYHMIVKSHLVTTNGQPAGPPSCYSSMKPETAEQHAHWLNDIGIDFVIFDLTNISKMTDPTILATDTVGADNRVNSKDPSANKLFQSSVKAIEGFRRSGFPIKVAYQLSLTCWQRQCHQSVPAPPHREIYTWNSHVRKHVEEIYRLYQQYRNDDVFETVPNDKDKPLLLFYCSQGNNVYKTSSPHTLHWDYNTDLRDHYPRWTQFNETVSTGELVRDLFSVRFALHCPNRVDLSAAPELWPFQCDVERCKFNEIGYASLRVGDTSRSITRFDRMCEDARGKDYLMMRTFNEFSTTDECYVGGKAYTFEVNNYLHHYDEQNGDPWYHWNRMRDKLSTL